MNFKEIPTPEAGSNQESEVEKAERERKAREDADTSEFFSDFRETLGSLRVAGLSKEDIEIFLGRYDEEVRNERDQGMAEMSMLKIIKDANDKKKKVKEDSKFASSARTEGPTNVGKGRAVETASAKTAPNNLATEEEKPNNPEKKDPTDPGVSPTFFEGKKEGTFLKRPLTEAEKTASGGVNSSQTAFDQFRNEGAKTKIVTGEKTFRGVSRELGGTKKDDKEKNTGKPLGQEEARQDEPTPEPVQPSTKAQGDKEDELARKQGETFEDEARSKESNAEVASLKERVEKAERLANFYERKLNEALALGTAGRSKESIENDNLGRQIEKLEATNAELKKTNLEKDKRLQGLDEVVTWHQEALRDLNPRVEKLEESDAEKDREIKRLKAEFNTVNAQKDTEIEKLKKELEAAKAAGGARPVEQPQDPNTPKARSDGQASQSQTERQTAQAVDQRELDRARNENAFLKQIKEGGGKVPMDAKHIFMYHAAWEHPDWDDKQIAAETNKLFKEYGHTFKKLDYQGVIKKDMKIGLIWELVKKTKAVEDSGKEMGGSVEKNIDKILNLVGKGANLVDDLKRKKAAKYAGLPEASNWSEIKGQMAMELGMEGSQSWKKIKKNNEKRKAEAEKLNLAENADWKQIKETMALRLNLPSDADWKTIENNREAEEKLMKLAGLKKGLNLDVLLESVARDLGMPTPVKGTGIVEFLERVLDEGKKLGLSGRTTLAEAQSKWTKKLGLPKLTSLADIYKVRRDREEKKKTDKTNAKAEARRIKDEKKAEKAKEAKTAEPRAENKEQKP